MDDPWSGIGSLTDSSRRALYDYVWRQDHPVTREEAADATGMSRGLAAFHLDKLVDAGLLTARYQAPPDQPRGRGRTPKVYEPAGDGITLTIPERRYELIAQILADAVADDPAHADEAAQLHARRRGWELGDQLTASGAGVQAILSTLGFEPRAVQDGIRLDNCPFHALATRHTALVCGINHAFVTGVLDAVGDTDLQARLVPRPGACCVEVSSPETTPASEPSTGRPR